MSTPELTKKIESLSSSDYNIVVMLVDRLYEHTIGLKKKSENELVDELLASARRSDEGHVKPAHKVSEEMRHKYAL